jgi:hypothetical protein
MIEKLQFVIIYFIWVCWVFITKIAYNSCNHWRLLIRTDRLFSCEGIIYSAMLRLLAPCELLQMLPRNIPLQRRRTHQVTPQRRWLSTELRCHKPQDHNTNLHRRENFTARNEMFTSFKINLKPSVALLGFFYSAVRWQNDPFLFVRHNSFFSFWIAEFC